MKRQAIWIFICAAALLGSMGLCPAPAPRIAERILDPATESIAMYWKNDSGQVFGNIGSLQRSLEYQGKALRFAMNGGMYTTERSPLGLYVEKGVTLKAIDKHTKGYGNFYMQPNGVFGIMEDRKAFVVRTEDYVPRKIVEFATQKRSLTGYEGNDQSIVQAGFDEPEHPQWRWHPSRWPGAVRHLARAVEFL